MIRKLATTFAAAGTLVLAALAAPAAPAAALPAGGTLTVNWSIPAFPPESGIVSGPRNIQVTVTGGGSQQSYTLNGPATSGTFTHPIAVAGTYSVTAVCVAVCYLTPSPVNATINHYNGYVRVSPSATPGSVVASHQCWLASRNACALGSY